MTATALVPVHIELRRLYRGADQFEHELAFNAVGATKPARVVVRSDLFSKPEIIEHLDGGGIALDGPLLDRLALKCFALLAGLISEHDGESGWWTFPDFSRFVGDQFDLEVAELILVALTVHVDPDIEVRSACLVADDDAV
jgi:hypothetical protein